MEDLDRDTAKFYDKIRQSLPLLRADSRRKGHLRRSRKYSASNEDRIFGNVTKDQMEEILKCYEAQQLDESRLNKPVVCDENVVKGKSFARMLYAQPGFHHLGSTEYLINELNINDDARSSFLGYYNSLSVADSDDLEGLKRKYVTATIEKIVKLALEQMDLKNLPQAKLLIDQALKLDPTSGRAKVAKGIYHNQMREYEVAVKELRGALECKDVDKIEARPHLSNAFHQLGISFYNRNNWEQAEKLFSESLRADPENEGARLHQHICAKKLQAESHSRKSFRPVAPSYRK